MSGELQCWVPGWRYNLVAKLPCTDAAWALYLVQVDELESILGEGAAGGRKAKGGEKHGRKSKFRGTTCTVRKD